MVIESTHVVRRNLPTQGPGCSKEAQDSVTTRLMCVFIRSILNTVIDHCLCISPYIFPNIIKSTTVLTVYTIISGICFSIQLTILIRSLLTTIVTNLHRLCVSHKRWVHCRNHLRLNRLVYHDPRPSSVAFDRLRPRVPCRSSGTYRTLSWFWQ